MCVPVTCMAMHPPSSFPTLSYVDCRRCDVWSAPMVEGAPGLDCLGDPDTRLLNVEKIGRQSVPYGDNPPLRIVDLETQDTDGSRSQRKMLPFGDGKTDPSRRKNPSELAMGKERHFPVDILQARNDQVGTRADILRCFTTWAAIFPCVPIGMQFANIGAAQVLIVSIVPFRQVRFDLGLYMPGIAKSCQLAGLACAQEWTGQYP